MTSSSQHMYSVAVLISGSGTTLKNLIEHQQRGELNCTIGLVISSRPDARGLEFAINASIESRVIAWKDFETTQEFSDAIFDACRQSNIDLVVMGGFLKHVLIPADFENRVINVHPSLIPNFSGKGMYGLRVHEAVLDSGVEQTGCTVHFVDNEYDHGPIIAQAKVPVVAGDDPTTLQQRVMVAERKLYPEVINQLAKKSASAV